MAPEPHSRRIPDILLERFLADDLPATEKARIQAALAADPSLRQALELLNAERRAFLAENPAAPFAHQLAVRLDVGQETARPAAHRRVWAWVLGPSLAAATTFLVIATVVRNTAAPDRVAAVGQAAAPATGRTFAEAPAPQPVLAPEISPPAATAAEPSMEGSTREDADAPRKPMGAKLKSGKRSTAADLEDAGLEEKPAKRPVAEKGRAKGRSPSVSASDELKQESPGGWHELAGHKDAATGGSGEPAAGATSPKPDRRPEPTKPAPRYAAEPPPVATATPAPAPAPPPSEVPATTTAAPAADAAAEPEALDRDKTTRAESKKAPAPTAAMGPAKGKASGADGSVFGDAEVAPVVVSTAYRNDVIAGVNTNAKSLEPCLTAAKARGELYAGKQILVLSWTIKADGSVTAPSLVGPASLASKPELTKCVSRRMASWKFKALGESVPVRNYALQWVVP